MLTTKDYMRFNEYKPITLDGMYNGDTATLANLDYNLEGIITTEAPITLNTLKQRLREAFGVKKISEKALNIIDEHIKKLGFPSTDNLYDVVYWPNEGICNPNILRINSNRQIYDVPYQEMRLLVNELNLKGEELYRQILSFYGFEVLTEKAHNYLRFVESKSN